MVRFARYRKGKMWMATRHLAQIIGNPLPVARKSCRAPGTILDLDNARCEAHDGVREILRPLRGAILAGGREWGLELEKREVADLQYRSPRTLPGKREK